MIILIIKASMRCLLPWIFCSFLNRPSEALWLLSTSSVCRFTWGRWAGSLDEWMNQAIIMLTAFKNEGIKILHAHTSTKYTYTNKDKSQALPCYDKHLSLKPFTKQLICQALWQACCYCRGEIAVISQVSNYKMKHQRYCANLEISTLQILMNKTAHNAVYRVGAQYCTSCNELWRYG